MKGVNMIRNRIWIFKNEPNPGDPGVRDGGNTDDAGKGLSEQERQSLIDQGVNIGFARGSEKAAEKTKQELEGKLSELGLSFDTLGEIGDLVKHRNAIPRLLELYGATDLGSLVTKAETERRSRLSAEELAREDQRRLSDSLKDLESRALTAETAIADLKTSHSLREKALLARIEEQLVDGNLRRFAEPVAYDTEDVIPRLRGNVKLIEDADGKFTTQIVDDHGAPKLDKEGKPFTFEQLVSELLEAKPHLRKAGTIPGVGSKPSKPGAPPVNQSKFTREQIADPVFFEANKAAILKSAVSGA